MICLSATMPSTTNSTNKDPKWLQILTILLSNTILPFISYIEEDTEDEAFEIFKKYATTNPNIFYDFSRYINKRLATGELVQNSNDQENDLSSSKQGIHKKSKKFLTK